jgi:hypothetical protein
MNTLTDEVLPVFEKVVHIAFGCACVRTFHVEQLTLVRCPIHGDPIVSSTEELVEKTQAA